MSDIVELMKDGIDPSVISVDDIKRNAEDVRKRILDETEVDLTKTAPNVYNYELKDDSIGLSEISNVDMGYAGTTVDFAGEHISKRTPYLKELEYNTSLMKDSENAIVLLNGGLFSYIPKTMKGKMLSYQDQIAYFYSLFKDLADEGKIVAMVRGTSEHRILKNHKVDMLGILQEALGLDKKVCNDALVNVQIEDDIVGKANVGIRTINWHTTAGTGAYIGRKMEERATKRGGADIYVARTAMNFFKPMVASESKNGQIIKKPVYLISGGSYTPFKGAMTAGAEYNSIKDGELSPNSFWYKVTIEEAKKNLENGAPNYYVRVNPIQYVAHQITQHGTDELTASIENSIEGVADGMVQRFVDDYSNKIGASRVEGRKRIREILGNNKSVASENEKIREYIEAKKGKEKVAQSAGARIVDKGSNVPTVEPRSVMLGDLEDEMI